MQHRAHNSLIMVVLGQARYTRAAGGRGAAQPGAEAGSDASPMSRCTRQTADVRRSTAPALDGLSSSNQYGLHHNGAAGAEYNKTAADKRYKNNLPHDLIHHGVQCIQPAMQ